MTENKNIASGTNKIIIRPRKGVIAAPIIIRKQNNVVKRENSGELSIINMKFGSASAVYKEDVIYDSNDGQIHGEYPFKVVIVNKFNLLTNSSRTIATYTNIEGKVCEKTSDQITKVIGQKNYDTILAVLCCGNLSEELKVKAILALLTDSKFEEKSVQTDDPKMELKEDLKQDVMVDIKIEVKEEKCCQTDENCMDLIYKFKQKKRTKRSVLKPYIINDIPKRIEKKTTSAPVRSEKKRVIEDLDKKIKFETKDQLPGQLEENQPLDKDLSTSDLPQLCLGRDFENTSDSDLTSIFSMSCESVALGQAETQIVNSIGQHTTKMNFQPSKILLPDGSSIMVPVKPEDEFHIAIPEILNHVIPEEKQKLLWYQAYIDWKRCLDRDADGYLPLHNAVLNKDVDLVKRQCVVLRTRKESLDILAGNMTALQMSILQDSVSCTIPLLQYGADPLFGSDAALHLAAEGSSGQLRAVLAHAPPRAREILLNHEELWKPEYEQKSDGELADILVNHMCMLKDTQGYTPLMLAAKLGNYTNVMSLLEACPACVDVRSPNSGNTAIFLAVAEACLDAARRGNKSKLADHFNRTITVLLQHGADPTIPNHAGTCVADLLTESPNTELSMLLANTVTAVKFRNGVPSPANFDSYMLLKDDKGDVNLTDIKANPARVKKPRTRKPNILKTSVATKEKPKILENISFTSTATKKVIIDPQSVIRGDIKLISPKEKLISAKSPTKTSENLSQNTIKIVATTSLNQNFLTIPFMSPNELVLNTKTDSIKTEKETSPTTAETNEVVVKVEKQAVKRKSASQVDASDKKSKIIGGVKKG